MWSDDFSPRPDLTKAFPCDINKGVIDDKGNLLPMTANIYVDDVLAAAACRKNMLRLLTAIIEAIFTVCRTPDMAVRQCPLSLKKWHELTVGPVQIALGLVINTNTMTVGITDEYIDKVQILLSNWDPNKRFFQVNDMQKLIGKLARLGEGAPWIFKLMSHLYLFIGPLRGLNFVHGLHLKWVPTFLVNFLLLPNSRVRMYVRCTVKYLFGSFSGSSNLSPKLR